MENIDYVTRVYDDPRAIDAQQWDALLAQQAQPTPFMQHAYLSALHASACANTATGWRPHFVALHAPDGQLAAACPFYIKTHSRGEYVFDWAWADAYRRYGLAYYPKGLVAVPFTPAPGSRLLARNDALRARLVRAIQQECEAQNLSSWHLLFGNPDDLSACRDAGMMERHTVQFHWDNRAPQPYANFDDYLAQLTQEKRKKIKQERRKVAQADVTLTPYHGAEMSPEHIHFFYRCYAQTYREHGNPPYLSEAFFQDVIRAQPANWLLFVAHRHGEAIASSLIALAPRDEPGQRVAWGRYWGALARVDCLHFEACYYAPLQWCIEHGYQRFEGGAQGEHKLARALMPVKTTSAHWIARPEFAQAIQEFLEQERDGVEMYVDELEQHSPMKGTPAAK